MSTQKDDPGVRMAAQEGAGDLLRRLRSAPTLSELAVNPLLLTMIATVHRYKSSLPGRRVELFKEICEVFLGKRQQAKGLVLDMTPAQKQRVLQPLAYQMMVQEQREITLDDALIVIAEPLQLVSTDTDGNEFLKMIEDSSGLLLERESGEYSFAHLTFQEYLAAVHCVEQPNTNVLVDHIDESWWHETIRLYTAQTDATPIIEACLSADPPPVPALMLAIEVGEEALEIEPEARQRLLDVIDQGVEDEDPVRRRVVAETLLAYRLRHLLRVDDDTYIDTTLITHAEYQLFLDDLRTRGDYRQPDHWQTYQFTTGQGKLPVVGVRPSDAISFCAWLTEREASDWHYRLPVREELVMYELTQVDGGLDVGWWAQTGDEAVYEGLDSIQSSPSYTVLNLDNVSTGANAIAIDLGHDRARTIDRNIARAIDSLSDLNKILIRNIDGTKASAFAIAINLSNELEHVLTSVRDHVRYLVSDLENVFDPTRDQTRRHVSPRDGDLDRDSAFLVALARANGEIGYINHVLGHDLDVDFDFDPDFALDRAKDLDRAVVISLDLDRANNLTRDLDHIIKGDLGHASDLVGHLNRSIHHAIAHANDRAFALAAALALATDLVFNRSLNRSRTISFDFDLVSDQANYVNLDVDIARNHAIARDIDIDLTNGCDANEDTVIDIHKFYVVYARNTTLWLATAFNDALNERQQKKAWPQWMLINSEQRDREESIKTFIDNCLDTHLDFVVLEKRIAGRLPAIEGIRIVKERKPDDV